MGAIMSDEDKYFTIVKRRNTAGKGYYQARFYDSQKKLIKSKSFPPSMNKPEVTKEAADLLVSIIPTHDERDALAYCTAFWSKESEYFKGKATRNKTLSESYRRSGESSIKKAIPFLTGKKTGRISVSMLEAFETSLIESGLSTRNARGVIESISRPVNVYRKSISKPVLGKIEHGTAETTERGSLTLEEVSRVISYTGDLRARLIVLLGVLAGLRMGESRGLMVEDVDAENGELLIRHNAVFKSEGIKVPKGKDARKAPAPSVLLEAIDAVQAVFPGKFVVPNLSNPESPADRSTYRRAFPRVLRAIGISKEEQAARRLVFHGTRHTFITITQKVGFSEFVAQYLAGHKDVKVTRGYTHSEGQIDIKDVADTIEAAVRKAGKAADTIADAK